MIPNVGIDVIGVNMFPGRCGYFPSTGTATITTIPFDPMWGTYTFSATRLPGVWDTPSGSADSTNTITSTNSTTQTLTYGSKTETGGFINILHYQYVFPAFGDIYGTSFQLPDYAVAVFNGTNVSTYTLPSPFYLDYYGVTNFAISPFAGSGIPIAKGAIVSNPANQLAEMVAITKVYDSGGTRKFQYGNNVGGFPVAPNSINGTIKGRYIDIGFPAGNVDQFGSRLIETYVLQSSLVDTDYMVVELGVMVRRASSLGGTYTTMMGVGDGYTNYLTDQSTNTGNAGLIMTYLSPRWYA